MNALRVALATAAFLLCTGFGGSSDSLLHVQYRPVQQNGSATSSERERSPADAKAKERTPPPRPIVAPEGQQQNPALREDCAWLGQRIVSLLFRDDPMTGNDFIPFYTRFGCPEEHISRAFGCVVHSGIAENDALADRIAQCWTDPAQRAAPVGEKTAPAAPPPAGAPTAPAPAKPAEPAPR
jgi:hypothetical protein